MRRMGLLAAVVMFASVGCTSHASAEPRRNPNVGTQPGHVGHGTPLKPDGKDQLAIFAQGCFWGSEERFRKVPGVVSTAVGYTGGTEANPSYEEVSYHTGKQPHAESVLVEYDPSKVTYAQLLALFWSSHDPTTRDQQGPDVGPNYRSAIFTLNADQQKLALATRDEEQKHLTRPITTQIAPATQFWIAEGYHQQYDENHGYESCPMPRHAQRK